MLEISLAYLNDASSLAKYAHITDVFKHEKALLEQTRQHFEEVYLKEYTGWESDDDLETVDYTLNGVKLAYLDKKFLYAEIY